MLFHAHNGKPWQLQMIESTVSTRFSNDCFQFSDVQTHMAVINCVSGYSEAKGLARKKQTDSRFMEEAWLQAVEAWLQAFD